MRLRVIPLLLISSCEARRGGGGGVGGEKTFYCREALGTRLNLAESGYHRMRVDGRIRFEYATCGRGNFGIRNEKVADSKISGYVWTGSTLG